VLIESGLPVVSVEIVSLQERLSLKTLQERLSLKILNKRVGNPHSGQVKLSQKSVSAA